MEMTVKRTETADQTIANLTVKHVKMEKLEFATLSFLPAILLHPHQQVQALCQQFYHQAHHLSLQQYSLQDLHVLTMRRIMMRLMLTVVGMVVQNVKMARGAKLTGIV